MNAALLDSKAAFVPDDDTPILTRRELREFRPIIVEEFPDVAALRRTLHMSQGAFATLFGIPPATVKDWEQGRRKTDAPARVSSSHRAKPEGRAHRTQDGRAIEVAIYAMVSCWSCSYAAIGMQFQFLSK